MRPLHIIAVVGCLIIIATTIASIGHSASESNRCPTGQAHGLAAISHDPSYLVGTIPSTFQKNPRYFFQRYNCLGRSAEVRRLDEGVYEVHFPGLRIRLALVSAISDEGVSASYFPVGQGIVRVVLRGPLSGEPIAQRRDVAFSVVVF